MTDEDLQRVIDDYARRGIPSLCPHRDAHFGACSGLLTWQYDDGSRESGSRRDFAEEHDLAITMRRARGNPLAQRYTARFGMTYKELPTHRAASRELLRARRAADLTAASVN